jgi:hypothetical protein
VKVEEGKKYRLVLKNNFIMHGVVDKIHENGTVDFYDKYNSLHQIDISFIAMAKIWVTSPEEKKVAKHGG